MKKREEPSPKIKALNTICVLVLLCSVIYMLIAGVKVAALGAIAVSLVGAATPVFIMGEGFMDVLTGVFEAVFEGIMVIVEGIAEFISGLFG